MNPSCVSVAVTRLCDRSIVYIRVLSFRFARCADRSSFCAHRRMTKQTTGAARRGIAKISFFMAASPPERLLTSIARPLERLDDHGRSISQHFGDAVHYLVGVVAGADDGVRPDLGSVLDHDFKGLAARLLTKLREERDVAADECLQGSADRAKDRTRTHCDAAHNAEVAHDTEARQFERGRDHVMRDRITRRRDGIGSLYVNLVFHTSISGGRLSCEPSVRLPRQCNLTVNVRDAQNHGEKAYENRAP